MLGLLNLAWIAFGVFVVDGQVPLLAVALLILAAVGWFFMGRGETEAKRQFDGDAGYAGSPAEAITRPSPGMSQSGP